MGTPSLSLSRHHRLQHSIAAVIYLVLPLTARETSNEEVVVCRCFPSRYEIGTNPPTAENGTDLSIGFVARDGIGLIFERVRSLDRARIIDPILQRGVSYTDYVLIVRDWDILPSRRFRLLLLCSIALRNHM
ncbi:hypothetical protein F5Y10DRAFT_241954 [Nemania abortiva]|nr:hypothetical protein F5Y10DRAFT_241954 [Nemania abortiva]